MKEVEFMHAYVAPTRDIRARGGSSQGHANVQSWEREVERAQMASWFHAAPKSACDTAGAGAGRTLATEPIVPARQEAGVKDRLFHVHAAEHKSAHRPGGEGFLWSRSLGVRETELSATALGSQSTSADVVTQTQLLEALRTAVVEALPVGASRTSGQERVETAPASGADTSAVMPRRGDQGEATAEDVRIHAQWYGNGVQVWLGVGGGVFGGDQTRIAKMVADLRRLVERRGDTLIEVVCNGQTIYRPAHSSAPHRGVEGLL
jgi:hypothetical protein